MHHLTAHQAGDADLAVNDPLPAPLRCCPPGRNVLHYGQSDTLDQSQLAREAHIVPRITHVRYIQDYCLELTFADGKQAKLDFRDRIVGRGGVFAPLEDLEFFKRVRVDPEIGTLVWPNEVDFCPDVLYSEATGIPLPALQPA